MPYEPGVKAISIEDTTPFATERNNKTDSYDTGVISRIVQSALDYGVNPYHALGLAMKESNLGNAGVSRYIGMEANPFHVNETYWPEVMNTPGNISQNFVDYAIKNLIKPGYEKFSNPKQVMEYFHRPNIKKWNSFTDEQAKKAYGYSEMLQGNPQINALVNSKVANMVGRSILGSIGGSLMGR
jgi:hypothetical protein